MSAPPEPALRLHHVGHAVRELAPAVELYLNRLGYLPASPAIHDPRQTAFVQFLRLPGDTVYLELVAPDGPASKLTAAVKAGGGLNHLGYTCAALEPTIETLEATGMKLICDPVAGEAFAGRRLCWLLGADRLPIELVERRDPADLCEPAGSP